MTRSKLLAAVNEAQRFIAKAQVALNQPDFIPGEITYPSKENAAVKRASLDLSRVLSELRNP
jgi:hypothetical protein